MTGSSRTASEHRPLLRRLQLLIVALCAIVGAGAVSSLGIIAGLASVALPSAATAVASPRDHATRPAATASPARPQDTAARPSVDRDGVVVDVEDDLDDDDIEHRGAIRPQPASDTAAPLRGARLSRRAHADRRGHPQFDRSRFATGRGLLRGPPT